MHVLVNCTVYTVLYQQLSVLALVCVFYFVHVSHMKLCTYQTKNIFHNSTLRQIEREKKVRTIEKQRSGDTKHQTIFV